MSAKISKRDKPDWLAARLKAAGLRTTRPRLALADLLFGKGDRHITAEQLYGEARAAGLSVSQATIYNTLNQFHAVGLLREVQVDPSRSYFDTNTSDHHHFYIEEEGRLIDIEKQAIPIASLPDSPDGFQISDVEIIIRLTR
jgi:Fur family iron response transcriptional regulator